jgi:hypothetical protein
VEAESRGPQPRTGWPGLVERAQAIRTYLADNHEEYRPTMKFSKAIGSAALLLSFTWAVALAQESATPIPSESTPGATATSAAPAAMAKLKPIKSRFLLSHSSSVYAQPDKTSAVIAHVHRKTHVSVTGVIGDWLQIRLVSGKTGYIPSSAAE